MKGKKFSKKKARTTTPRTAIKALFKVVYTINPKLMLSAHASKHEAKAARDAYNKEHGAKVHVTRGSGHRRGEV